MAVGQTFSALLPWYRCLNPTEVDPGTDICFFTTLGQMAQSKKKTPGQTFASLLPWDRWFSPKRRPRDRHLLLYYPGTDGSVQKEDPGTDIYCFTTLGQMAQSKKKTPGQTFTALLPWDRWLSPKRRPRDRHLLLYYPETDGSVQKEDPGTDIYCFTTLGQMTQSNQSRLWDDRHFTAVA